jgi:hypothetical protein
MIRTLAVAAAILSVTACLSERTYVDPNEAFTRDFQRGDNSEGFSRGQLVGDIGPITNFNDQQATVSGYTDSEFQSSSVTVTGASPNGTGFLILDIYDLDLKSAPAGVYNSSLSGESNVNVIGCSDSPSGDVHYDGPAEEATVTITDISEREREVTIDATLTEDGYSDFQGVAQSTASFRMAR